MPGVAREIKKYNLKKIIFEKQFDKKKPNSVWQNINIFYTSEDLYLIDLMCTS